MYSNVYLTDINIRISLCKRGEKKVRIVSVWSMEKARSIESSRVSSGSVTGFVQSVFRATCATDFDPRWTLIQIGSQPLGQSVFITKQMAKRPPHHSPLTDFRWTSLHLPLRPKIGFQTLNYLSPTRRIEQCTITLGENEMKMYCSFRTDSYIRKIIISAGLLIIRKTLIYWKSIKVSIVCSIP